MPRASVDSLDRTALASAGSVPGKNSSSSQRSGATVKIAGDLDLEEGRGLAATAAAGEGQVRGQEIARGQLAGPERERGLLAKRRAQTEVAGEGVDRRGPEGSEQRERDGVVGLRERVA